MSIERMGLAFVGADLLRSGFTGFCPLAKILKAFAAKPSGKTYIYERVKSFLI